MVFTKWGWWVGNITLKCISCFFSFSTPHSWSLQIASNLSPALVDHADLQSPPFPEVLIAAWSHLWETLPLSPYHPQKRRGGVGRGEEVDVRPRKSVWGLRHITLYFYLATKPVAHWFWDGAPCPCPCAHVLDLSVGLCAPSVSGLVEIL